MASIIEGCFAENVDVEDLDSTRWQDWRERIGRYFSLPPFDALDSPEHVAGRYWLLNAAGEPVGTIGLPEPMQHDSWLKVQALYVRPAERRLGIASSALDATARAAVTAGLLGLRLGTEWTWQRTLHFYMARGFWCWNWKHDIQLILEPNGPTWSFTKDAESARFIVTDGGTESYGFTARRDDERLEVEEWSQEERSWHEWHHARETFSLILALAGWPLVRSESRWARRFDWSDAGESEGLAYKIDIFEGTARDSGWTIRTATIPGLERWQTWARGQEFGERSASLQALEAVLEHKGWSLQEIDHSSLSRLHPYALRQLHLHALRSPTSVEWTAQMKAWLGVEGHPRVIVT